MPLLGRRRDDSWKRHQSGLCYGHPQAAKRDATGLYDRVWREEVDDFIEFLRDEAEDPEIAVDAIVTAATVPGAPFRIPVGDGIGDEMRGHAQRIVRRHRSRGAFLSANRHVGSP